MKSVIIVIALFTTLTAQAAQVKSDCSAINENRQKITKSGGQIQMNLKKSALNQ